jgi:hypothetical protein
MDEIGSDTDAANLDDIDESTPLAKKELNKEKARNQYSRHHESHDQPRVQASPRVVHNSKTKKA